jgi:hypothetical protein
MSRKSTQRRPSPDPALEENLDTQPEGLDSSDTGTQTQTETLDKDLETSEEPAKVKYQVEGSPRAVEAAARKLANNPPQRPAAAPEVDKDLPPEDPVTALLSDGKNMVIVTRQTPRSIRNGRGEKFVTNSRLPGKYTCPTSVAAIEDQVFGEHGGQRYKCTIHPDTSNGENQILGHFTIEHPDPGVGPFIEGVTDVEEEQEETQIPTHGDPTLRETDTLVEVREQLKRQLERANTMKEIQETKRLIKSIQDEIDGKTAAAASAIDPRDAEIARLRAENAEKKTNDRFDKLENAIASLATAIATKPAAPAGPDPLMTFMVERMKSDDTRFTALMTALTAKQHTPPPPATPPVTLESTLDTITKVKNLVSPKGDSAMADLQSQLLQSAIDRLNGGGDDAAPAEEDEQDVVKYGIKQLTPVLKTWVEKTMEKETAAAGGEGISKERVKEIYAEAAQKAARDLAEKWQREGLVVVTGADGKPSALPAPKKGATVPPRHAGSKVIAERMTAEGRVKTVQVERADLKPAKESNSNKEGGDVKFAEFEGLGEGGTKLKVELPPVPGDMKYDRKRSVNFVLDAIRSEIRMGVPEKKEGDVTAESYVPSDALEYLDDEILAQIADVDSGETLEKVVGPWSDPARIAEIRDAGKKDESTASWLRRIFLTIRDAFRDLKNAQNQK